MLRTLGLGGLLLALLLAGCGLGDSESSGGDELTSKAAVERQLTIKAFVYVDEDASTYEVQSAVQRQVRTAFGPLRIGQISVDDREFRNNIDPSTFSKQVLEVVQVKPDGTRTVLTKTARVSYTYKARALVEKGLAQAGTFPAALLMGNYQGIVDEIIKDCVENYAHDRDFADAFWYVWSPNEPTCKALIEAETKVLESERKSVGENQIGEKEYGRRYLPLSVQLDPVEAAKTTYPEYDQLYGIGDASKDRIVVYQVAGLAAHDDDPVSTRFESDLGFKEFYKTQKVLADRFKSLRVAEGSAVNPLSVTFKDKTYTGTFADLYNWVVSQKLPSDVASTDSAAFRRAIYDAILMKWVKLEVPLTVSGAGATKKMTLEIRLLFGADSSYSVKGLFREAFKNGDVVMYNGHSYIGSGPLDPSNYSASDFSDRYQILVFNSCVSFNYYGVNYFKLKNGGSKNLDLISNGLEVYINDGGKSMGQLIAALFSGKQSSWLSILDQTAVDSYWGVHDPNRNVDGEIDNAYDPSKLPITVTEGSAPVPTLTVKNVTAACGGTASGTVELAAESAGAAKVEFLIQGTRVASDSSAPFSATWDSTTARNGKVELRVVAYDAAGKTAEDACSFNVSNSEPANDLFFDDMESGAAKWTATGLWHLAQNSKCASPGYASASGAWYFGQDATCNYDTGTSVKGTLISPSIAGVTASSKLTFKLYREVESGSSGSYDKTSVEVAEAGSNSWKTVWSKDSRDASSKSWSDSGAISLSEYAGKSIKLRFSFDAVDNYQNDQTGWLIDDVRVTP